MPPIWSFGLEASREQIVRNTPGIHRFGLKKFLDLEVVKVHYGIVR
jgi:hypothetical protein